MERKNLRQLVVFAVILASLVQSVSCRHPASTENDDSLDAPPPDPVVLARGVGGAWHLCVSQGRVYFDADNPDRVLSVPTGGGEIITHHAGNMSGPIAHGGGRIYAAGGYSLPDTAVGVSTLSRLRKISNWPLDIATDGSYVYWVEYDSTPRSSIIVRVPLTISSTTPLDRDGYSTDLVIDFDLQGRCRFVMEGSNLYVSEGQTGILYRVDLSTGNAIVIANGLGGETLNEVPLVACHGSVYAMVGQTDIIRVNTVTGEKSLVTSGLMYQPRLECDGEAVYWWESGAEVANLKRVNGLTGEVTTVCDKQGGSLLAFHADGTQVWWISELFDTEVWCVPGEGGSPNLVATIDDSALSPPDSGALTSDTTNLYWLNDYGGFTTMPKAGGVAHNVSGASGSLASVLAVADDCIVLGGCGGSIRKVPKGGQTLRVLEVDEGNAYLEDIRVDSDNVYFLYYRWESYESVVDKLPLHGGPLESIATLVDTACCLAVGKDYIYVGGGGAVCQIPKAGGDQTVIANFPGEVRDIDVDGDELIVLSRNGISVLNLSTLSLKALLEANNWPASHLYVDPNHIYWMESGTVCRIPRDGGIVQRRWHTTYGAGQIDGDSDRIYWAASDQVLSQYK
jgi:hypothetical protein